MSKLGRPPKPRALKLLTGTLREPAGQRDEIRALAGVPAPPGHLPPAARGIWRELAPQLVAVGLLAETDLVSLEGLVVALHRARQADREVDRRGVLVPGDRGGLVRNPAAVVAAAA